MIIIILLKRERPILVPTALPCIFPNLPKYLSKSTVKRKAPAIRIELVKKRKFGTGSETSSLLPVDSSSCNVQIIFETSNVNLKPLYRTIPKRSTMINNA